MPTLFEWNINILCDEHLECEQQLADIAADAVITLPSINLDCAK